MPLRIEHAPPLVVWTIDRPARKNAVDRETAEALADAVRAFEADDALRVAILYGDHGTFCAGADLVAVAEGRPNRLEDDGDAPMGPSRMRPSKPVIAAIAGHAVAGGLELALFADLRVAEEDAVLGVFCRRFGVPLIDGGTVRLPRVVGLGRALDLILTGRPVGAEEALAMGLVNRIVPKGSALDAARELADSLARFPWTCLVGDRNSVYEGLDLSFDEAMKNEFRHGRAALKQESLAGATRFRDGAGRGGTFES